MFGRKVQKTARFLVVSKRPDGLAYAPNSAVAPVLPEPDKLFRVLLRFDPRQEDRHPDDNDLVLICDPSLHAILTEGTHVQAVWEGKRLLSFDVCP